MLKTKKKQKYTIRHKDYGNWSIPQGLPWHEAIYVCTIKEALDDFARYYYKKRKKMRILPKEEYLWEDAKHYLFFHTQLEADLKYYNYEVSISYVRHQALVYAGLIDRGEKDMIPFGDKSKYKNKLFIK